MTISSTTRKTLPYVGDGASTVFAFEFKVFTTADIYAVELDEGTSEETVLVLGSDFTATLNPNQDTDPGGEITLASPLAIGKQLVISSDIQPLQQTDLTNQGGFYPSVITKALDKLTIVDQQLVEASDRTLKLPITVSSDVSADVPVPVSDGVLKWNTAARALEAVTLAGIVPGTVPVATWAATLLDDTSANYARHTLSENRLFLLAVSATLVGQDSGRIGILSSTYTLLIDDAALLGNGWYIDLYNAGTGVITVDPFGAQTIDGAPSMKIHPGQHTRIESDAANLTTTQRGGVYAGTFTRDVSLASGNQSITGLGFKPRALLFIGNVTTTPRITIGFATPQFAGGVYNSHNTAANSWTILTTACMAFDSGGGALYTGTVGSFDSDGFTIAWTKAGAPSATATIVYLAIR